MQLCEDCVPPDLWDAINSDGELNHSLPCLSHRKSPTLSSNLLQSRLEEMLELYRPAKVGHSLSSTLVQDWGFPDRGIASTLVSEHFPEHPLVAANAVDLAKSSDALDMWETLTEELRSRNRFFASKSLDLELIRLAIESQENVLSARHVLYRARLATPGKRRTRAEMKAPPAEKALAGRANPDGISYLYLGDSVSTCVAEVRASIADEVAVAEYSAVEELSIVDLSYVDGVQFGNADSPESSLSAVRLLRRLSLELSLPVRRSADQVHQQYSYLPAQFLCEYIKSLDYHGVRYPSAMNPGGSNLVLFEEKRVKMKRNPVSHYRVNALLPEIELVP